MIVSKSLIYKTPPLVYLTGIYILGIAAQHSHNHQIVLPLVTCLMGTSLYFYTDHIQNLKKIIAPLALCFGLYGCGALLLKQQIATFERFHRYVNKQQIDVIGTVADIQHNNKEIVILLKNIATKQHNDTTNSWTQHREKIQIHTKQQENIRVNDRIQLHNILIKNKSSTSFTDYLIKEGIGATLFIPKLEYTLIATQPQSWQHLIHAKKESIYNSLRKKFSPHCFTVFSALFLGKSNNNNQSTAIKEAFGIWGILHYLARSGLHLVILVYLWLLFLNMLPIPCNYKHSILITINILYCMLSWPSIPFYRALATVILYKISTLLRLQNNFLHLLALTCFSILLYNPIQLLFLDFQLSFGLTFALAYFSLIKKELINKPQQTIATR